MNRSEAINKGFTFYKKWRTQKTYSPALDTEISITRKGWNHITNKRRTYKDVIRRIKLLPYAQKLIKKSTTIQNIRRDKSKTFIAMEHIFDLNVNKKVRVILESENENSYRFLSVMDKKI